jgi:hypothetical protein
MVFTGKIDPETHAYIKFNRNTPVVELMKETKVSRAQIYKIKKEPLRTKIISKRLKGPGGRPEKLSVRDKRALLWEIKALRRENGNWTVRRLMGSVNILHVSVRTVTRFLRDKSKQVKFARKMIKEYNINVWTKDVAFYLDGVSFTYKKNPKDQAVAPTGRVWRKANEGLIAGCTAKGKKCGTGGKTVKLIVAISYGKGVICCEYYIFCIIR